METTLLLAKLIGPILLLLGLSFLMNKNFHMEWFKRLEKDGTWMFFWAIIETSAGLALVLHHNVWGSLPEVLVTLMGWGMLLEGAPVLLGGRKYVQMIMGLFHKSVAGMLNLSILLGLAAGGYLTWFGYFA